jgi:hypothetical protein
MKIIITENQLSKIRKYINDKNTNEKINEQGFGGAAGIVGAPQQLVTPEKSKFSCLPTPKLDPFIFYILKNKVNLAKKLGISEQLLMLLTKAAVGVMKRETDYGLSYKSVGESLLDWFDDTFLFQAIKTSGKGLQSLGPAQFTKGTWKNLDMEKKFGMPIQSLKTFTGAGLGTIVSLLGNYNRAKNAGYTTNSKAVNPFLQKKGVNFKSTGNAALDIAIGSHNMNLINKWCYTSNPNLAGPCKNPTYQPYKKDSPEFKKYGILKVYQNKPIVNYFPNKGHKGLTSFGYLEEVVDVIWSLKCF